MASSEETASSAEAREKSGPDSVTFLAHASLDGESRIVNVVFGNRLEGVFYLAPNAGTTLAPQRPPQARQTAAILSKQFWKRSISARMMTLVRS